jgi:hypothetical protein
MTVTRAQAAELLEPKLSKIWYEAFETWPFKYTAFVNVRNTQKATVTDWKMTDFGPLVLKAEGQPITYDDPIFGDEKRYQPVRLALGYKITQEMRDHELYGITERLEKGLMRSAVHDLETRCHLLLNNGFGTTDADGFSSTGFDALGLFSTAHTRLDGGTNFQNRPSTDADLSVTSLQQAVKDMDALVDDRGRPAFIQAKLLLIHPDEKFTARELLQSEYKPNTANNEVNALQDEGMSFMVSPYLTDTDAWFLIGDQHDLNLIWDVTPRTAMKADGDEGFDSEVIKRKVVQGYVIGHGEARGVYGSQGA